MLPVKRPREADGSLPPKRIRICESKGWSGKISEMMKKINKNGEISNVLLRVMNTSLKLLRENKKRLELDASKHRETFEEKGVVQLLKACGWQRDERKPNTFLLDASPKNKLSIQTARAYLSNNCGPSNTSSSSEEKPSSGTDTKLVTVYMGAETKRTSEESMLPSVGNPVVKALDLCLTNSSRLLVRGMLRTFLNIIKKILKKPSDLRMRRLAFSSIIFKKFIKGPKGGMELALSCGFSEQIAGESSKNVASLTMETVDPQHLASVVKMIESYLVKLKSKEPMPVTASTKVRCGCGYWGSTDTGGLCSVCHRNKTFGLSSSSSSSKKEERAKSPEQKCWKAALTRARIKLKCLFHFKQGMKKRKAQRCKTRCYLCNKKVGYLGFECKCMFTFCEKHRFPDAHKCTFDHKRRHRNKLKKDNQALSADKLTKID
mmetsp:Transcript_23538/g.35219  ORF Transcript_23538/g.35219 Transcript_23538/m.35219 type:complete len:433 (+) Transcript_23538:96-1394(+)